ncbi:hypothetical protein EDEG_01713 [Edhazardia aedis USNM 41457]|uniref:Translation initiation factor beta propellor-like domain-containing protein n=1 Tax=Edhazardia aedis (strain USNM 41457) TaxID=1003232 RepID=J9DRQ3_EDHAE|nr:hypothetical protein EDEG_01713 [Edhazardia aedis USNM 41457]|eukprot:EJW04002.1 hypothetical protein EDEG_01713 [Edhazardia aedis USNM 41457]
MEHFSGLVTHSEKGLNLDTFSSDPIILPAENYVIKNGKVLYNDKIKNKVILYDIKTKKEIFSCDAKNIKTLLLNDKTSHLGFLEYKRDLCIYNIETLECFKYESVERCSLTDYFTLIYTNDSEIYIYNFENKQMLEMKFVVIDFVTFGKNIFFFTTKSFTDNKNVLFHYEVGKMINKYSFDNIKCMAVKSNTSKDMFLLNITTDYTGSSYYGSTQLFLYSKSKSNTYCLEQIMLAEPFLDFGFIKNGIFVNHGFQPSKVVILDHNLNIKKQFPDSVRNFVYFNSHENLVCFAGFNNLSGMIEVYRDSLISKFKVLGASKVLWSNNGSFVCVCVTNELKVDNRVIIFDYYGREICTKHFDNLQSVELVSNKKEEFLVLDKPKEDILKEDSIYVPPHLRNQKKNVNSKAQPGKNNLSSGANNSLSRNGNGLNSNNLKADEPKNLNVGRVIKDKFSVDLFKNEYKSSFSKNTSNVLATSFQRNIRTVKSKPEHKENKENQAANKINTHESIKDLEKKIAEINELKLKVSKGASLDMDCMNKILSENEILESLDKLKSAKNKGNNTKKK